MNKKEFIKRVTVALKENKITKPVSIPRNVFHISDDNGNHKDFTVKLPDREIVYYQDDVEKILDACVAVIEDAIRHGESVSYHGVGSLGLKYRQPRMSKIPGTDQWIEVPGRYVPKFTMGNVLRVAAQNYGLSLGDDNHELPPPIYDEFDIVDDEEEDDE